MGGVDLRAYFAIPTRNRGLLVAGIGIAVTEVRHGSANK